MKFLVIKKWQGLLSLLLVFFIVMLVVSPDIYMESCLKGIALWGNSVLPALFPFFFFSSILIKLGMLEKIGKFLSKFMQKFFHCPGSSGVIYLLSIISGYPVGAKITSELYANGALSKNQVVRINAFASTSGPLFIVGSVGLGMFVNQTCGIIMLISHILGALLNGLLYRNYKYKEEKAKSLDTYCLNDHTQEILSKTMYDSVMSILIVGGYIVIFNIVIDMLFNVGFLQFLGSVFGVILNFLGLSPSLGTGVAGGILEVTRGCLDLASSGADLKIITVLGCMLISWGGFSIHFQALTFLSKCKISVPFYFLQKFTHSLISGVLCLACVFLFGI